MSLQSLEGIFEHVGNENTFDLGKSAVGQQIEVNYIDTGVQQVEV